MATTYPFELDEFQKRAVYRVENSQCVLVAAHTSAGKTVVAEYAIAKSLKNNMKCVYTSPIKALSNQKYKEFKEKFGDVGIMTGDVTLNEEASCLIMTTEVLQSMLYRDSEILSSIDCVVFDEAHYLADPDRGYVWEEVIIMLPDHVNIVLLSATIPSYKELAGWVGRIRKKTVYIEITYYRPVPLNHYVLAARKMTLVKEGDKSFDKELVKHLFSDAWEKNEKAKVNKKGKHLKDKKKDDKVEQDGTPEEGKEETKDGEGDDEDESDDEADTTGQTQPVDLEAIKAQETEPEKTKLNANQKQYQKKAQKQKNKAALHHKYQGGSKMNKANNDLKQNVQLVVEKELYPCVIFVFSKKQCSELCLGTVGIDALTSREKTKVKQFFKKAVNKLDKDDRELHQIKELEFCLEQGVGYHHAGLLPILKEIVEILFAEGLIKVLFATTTFAMGLNMPARAVMFIKLEKFNGKEEVFLEAAEYIQMAGRAGRRGKDDVGYSMMYFEKSQMFMHQGIADKMNDMMNVKTGTFESKYKLTYRIILHVLSKGETGMQEIQKIMKSSFLENDNYKAKLSEVERIKSLEQQLDTCQEIECIKGVPEAISVYNSTLAELFNLNAQWASTASDKALCFPTIIEFTMDGQNYHVGTAIHNDKNTKSLTVLTADEIKRSPIEYEENKSDIADNSYNIIGYKNVTRSFANVLKTEVYYMDSVRLKHSSKQDILDELEALDPSTLKEPRAKKGGKKGKKPAAGGGGGKRMEFVNSLKESECSGCPEFAKHLKQINSTSGVQKEMTKMLKNVKNEALLKNEEFDSKMRVMKDLGFISKDDTLELKGKFAQHISSADIIILTVFVFEGGFISLSDSEMIASLAMTMIKAGGGSKDDIDENYLPPSFFENKTFLEGIAEQVISLEEKYGVRDEQKEAEKRLNLAFPLVAYEWAKKTKFSEICETSFQEAGTMVTALRSLVKLCEEMSEAYLEIENKELSERFSKLSEEMRRDILFLPSLYYEKDFRNKKTDEKQNDQSDSSDDYQDYE